MRRGEARWLGSRLGGVARRLAWWRGSSVFGSAGSSAAWVFFCICAFISFFLLKARNTGTLAQPPFLITTARLSFRTPLPSSPPHGLKNRRQQPGARRAPLRAMLRARRRRPHDGRAGGRRAAAPLVVVRLGRGVENGRRRRHSRVICVRNSADCEVKSGALLRWRSPQALAMSHLRGFGFARDRNHQKRHVRSEVSHLSCIARAPGATPSETRPT